MQDAVAIWLYGGGDIFSTRRSNPHSMQDAVAIWLYGCGDIFSTTRSYPHSMQWMQYAVDAVDTAQ